MARNRFMDDEELEKSVNWVLIRRLAGYLMSHKGKVFAALALMLISTGVGLLSPYLMRIAIDEYIMAKDRAGLWWIGGILLAAYLISMVAQRRRIQIMSGLSKNILMNMRQELFSHIQTLSFHFFDGRPVGKILARVISDVNNLHDLFTNSITNLIPDFITLVAVIFIMMSIHLKLALGTMIILPFLMISMSYIQNESRKRWQVVRKKSSNINAFIHESFAGIRVIQSFAKEKETLEIFLDLVRSLKDSWMRAVRVSNAFWPLVDLSWAMGSVIVYWYGTRLLGMGDITVGILVAFTSYTGMFWQPIVNISNFYNSLVVAMASAERIFEIMDLQPDIRDMEGARELPPIQGKVEFQKVHFSYEHDSPVLHDVSFTVQPGETIALVGPTGAGKTTIVNLVSRFYDPDHGKVLIDDHDIREVTLQSLRSQMGIMLQDTFLFSTSILENIRYGRLDATDEEVMEAAKAVNAHEFIMELEDGYHTQVSERGSRLSVGQRQLISFARALLADPRILILDEATSSIDTHTEILVQKALEKLLKGRTSFVIAHRLSTIRNADRIMIVDDNRIIESGTHQELMEKQGFYYNLYMSQYRFLEDEECLSSEGIA